MSVYVYQAVDSDRELVKGTIAADSPRQARELLRGRGLLVQQVSEHRAGGNSFGWWARLVAGRYGHLWSMACHELSLLLRAGIPLLEALGTIAQQYRGGFRTTIIQVRERVASGAGLAEAMKERPDVFDSLSVHLVEVGENAGTLDRVLDQLADFRQRSLNLKDELLTALLYPTFLLLFGLAATIFLMTYVLPPLLENLQDSLQALPWPTRVVKWFSDLLLHYGWLLLILAAGTFALGLAVLQTRRGRTAWHRVLLRLPLIGPIALKQGIARIAMIIATLIRSGVVLTKALELSARATSNLVLREALEHCGTRVGAGQDVASALERSGAFPPLAIQIFSIGQESGQLEEMLERLSEDYNRQVATRSARLAALLEPVLIVALAGLIGFVLLATILPILEAGNVL